MRRTYGVLGFCFHVVSASHSIEKLQTAVLAFVNTVPDLIASMEPADFVDNVRSLAGQKRQPFPSLSEAADHLWAEIEERRFHFHVLEEQAMLLDLVPGLPAPSSAGDQLSKEEMVTFSRLLFLEAERKVLVCQASVAGVPVMIGLPSSTVSASLENVRSHLIDYFPSLV